MIAAEAGIDTVHPLELIGEPPRRQATGRQPSARIGKARRDDQQDETDRRQPRQQGIPAQRRRTRHLRHREAIR